MCVCDPHTVGSCFHTSGRGGTRTGLWLESHAGEAGDEWSVTLNQQGHSHTHRQISVAVIAYRTDTPSCCVHQSSRIYSTGAFRIIKKKPSALLLFLGQMSFCILIFLNVSLNGWIWFKLKFVQFQVIKQNSTCSLSSDSCADSCATRVTVSPSFSWRQRISFCSHSPSLLTRDMALMRGNHSKFFSWDSRDKKDVKKKESTQLLGDPDLAWTSSPIPRQRLMSCWKPQKQKGKQTVLMHHS